MQRVVADLDEISWTKTQVRDVRGVTEVQMGKLILHLTGLRYWMVQMATTAPEHVPYARGHPPLSVVVAAAMRATPSDL